MAQDIQRQFSGNLHVSNPLRTVSSLGSIVGFDARWMDRPSSSEKKNERMPPSLKQILLGAMDSDTLFSGGR